MLVNRMDLIRHLNRLHCDGLIPEVALGSQLGATAQSTRGDLIVTTPGLAGVASLPREIGLSLEMLIGALAGVKGDKVEIQIDGKGIALQCSDRLIRRDLIEPDLITTKMEDVKYVRKVQDLLEHAWQQFPLIRSRNVVQAIRNLRAELVALQLRPSGMTLLVTDASRQTAVEFEVPEVKTQASFTLLVSARIVRGVFDHVGDSELTIAFAGPNGILGLRLGREVQYNISPLEETWGPLAIKPLRVGGP